mmetsp:Transcript_16655/g.26417  ORF Transcript_16655/g.26417 Transcript_16655/m.26417 type:complete len:240 (-) Transcript_16655:216-935(-)
MIQIHMRIANSVHKFAWLEITNLRHHPGQQRIGSDIERHSQSHISRPLIHLARQPTIRHIELHKHMARRQRHLIQIARIPRTHHNPARVGIVLDLLDAVHQLIHSLAIILIVHTSILRAKVSPLESINRSQVAFFIVRQTAIVQKLARAVSVPNMDAFVLQFLSRRGATHEPQQFLRYASPKHLLCGQQREDVILQRKPHLRSKNGQRASSRSISSLHALRHNLFNQAQILILFVTRVI